MTTTERKPVDIREFFDELLAMLERTGSDKGTRYAATIEARDAVAELIEKADNAARILHNAIAAGQIGAGYQTNLDDLRAALARVQGGQ